MGAISALVNMKIAVKWLFLQTQRFWPILGPKWIMPPWLYQKTSCGPHTVREDVLTMSMNFPSNLDLVFGKMRFQPIPQSRFLDSGESRSKIFDQWTHKADHFALKPRTLEVYHLKSEPKSQNSGTWMSIQSTLFDKTKQLFKCLCLFLFQPSVDKKHPFVG